MNESDFDAKIREACKLYLPGSLFFKTNDLATEGVPDIAITWASITSWIEDKYWRKRDTLKKVIHSKLQIDTIRRLGARASFVVWRETPPGVGIFTADEIEAALAGRKHLVFKPGHDVGVIIRWIRQNSLFNCDRKI